jgi:hypothetical protein
MLKDKKTMSNKNIKYRNIILITLVLCVFIIPTTRAQEILSGIQYNPELNDAVKKINLKSLKSTSDTIALPFIDDFAYDGMYPDNTKWEEKYVFINTTYAVNPVTVGVATFDALNAGGRLYSRTKNTFGADTLTSKPINLQYNKKDSLLGSLIRKKNSESDFSLMKDSLFFEQKGTYLPVDTLNYYYKADDQLYTLHDTTYQSYTEPVYYYHNTDSVHYRFPYQGEDLSPADSVYLSFFYQPQGLGDVPESSDSLFVEFYNPVLDTWNIVYGIRGTELHDFKPALIPVLDNDYFNNGFRFRFRNIVSITGNKDVLGLRANVDHWHIDYVMLDKGRHKNDTAFKDVAFITPAPNILKDFSAMPWQHYLKIKQTNDQWKNNIQTQYVNLYDQEILGQQGVYAFPKFEIMNLQYEYNFGFSFMDPLETDTFNVELGVRPDADDADDANDKDSLSGSLIKKSINDTFSLMRDSLFFKQEGTYLPVDTLNYYYKADDPLYTLHDTTYQLYTEPVYYYHNTDSVHYRFPSQGKKDSATFKLTHYLTIHDSLNLIRKNDTISYIQKFHNYYAYDDGSAEAGYGLIGTKFGKAAYQFNSYKKDMLTAIYMYFNQDYDDTTTKLNFKLTIWDDDNGVPGDTLYSRYSEYPGTDDYYKPVFKGLNHYYPYYLQEPVAVSGTFYIGWEQFYEVFLNVGFDKNSDASEHLFYNTQGVWTNSGKTGALMMRPVFNELPVKTNIKKQHKTPEIQVKLFPNPADQVLHCQLSPEVHKTGLIISIYDIQGRLIRTLNYNNQINISDIPGGIYIVEIKNDSGYVDRKKLVIDRAY